MLVCLLFFTYAFTLYQEAIFRITLMRINLEWYCDPFCVQLNSFCFPFYCLRILLPRHSRPSRRVLSMHASHSTVNIFPRPLHRHETFFTRSPEFALFLPQNTSQLLLANKHPRTFLDFTILGRRRNLGEKREINVDGKLQYHLSLLRLRQKKITDMC